MQPEYVSDRFKPLNKPTLWQNVVSLCAETKSVSLSQGAPEFGPQPFYLDNLCKAVSQPCLQQPDTYGLSQLRQSIAEYHRREFKELDWRSNILVTAGASMALYSIFLTFIDPGDEVVLFEPAFDFYRHYATITKAQVQNVKLLSPETKTPEQLKALLKQEQGTFSKVLDWEIDWESLQAKLSPRTKLIILNSPHNPTGKIFTQPQLDRICELALKYPQIVIVEDNVYQGFMFDQLKGTFMPKIVHSKHYQSLKERVLSVYSAGKLLEATGARAGWILGDENVLKMIHGYNKTVLQGTSELIQKAVALCLDDIRRQGYYYLELEAARLEHHRKKMLEIVSQCKYDFKVAIPKGGYFLIADISKVQVHEMYINYKVQPGEERNSRDLAFMYQMAFEDGVVIIPCSGFFGGAQKEERFIRFALCKSLDAIEQAGKRIRAEELQLESSSA